jgi:hypothetical protein
MPWDKIAVLILVGLAAIGLTWINLHTRSKEKQSRSENPRQGK